MSRSETISVRVSAAQKDALGLLAQQEGRTLSDFVLRGALLAAERGLDEIKANATAVRALNGPKTATRKRKKPPEVTPFRTPSLPRKYAGTFEEAIRQVASKMRADPHTVGILMTHLAEAIGNVMARGQVFRWPGLFAAGPYLVDKGTHQCCLPRFQASVPLRNYIWFECPADRACNREMDAHRRRRRPDRTSLLPSAMSSMRHAISLQDKRICDALESDWRFDSTIHWQ